MTRLEELMLFILDRAEKEGKSDLSRFQLFKIPYLLQVYSLKYAGTYFAPGTTFIRQKNGPISVDIYKALTNLEEGGYIKKEIQPNTGYGYDKHAFSLNSKKKYKFTFDAGEVIFLDTFLSELLPLTQKQLKERAYKTEPMLEIQEKEKIAGPMHGAVIDFAKVSVDSDVVDTYSDA